MVITSAKTNKVYDANINALRKAMGVSGETLDFLNDSAPIIAYIEGLNRSPNTKKIIYISIVSRLGQGGTFAPLDPLLDSSGGKARGEGAYASPYKTKMNAYNQQQRDIYERQELSVTEQEKWLAWPQVLKAVERHRCSVASLMDFQDQLILSLYTLQAPVRLDYGDMRVVATEPEKPSGNYLVALPEPYFLFTEYKTAAKYGAVRIKVSPPLLKVIQEWRTLLPDNDFLLVSAKGAPLGETALGKRIIDLFTRMTGKAVGISMLRHSFVSHSREGEAPLSAQTALADSMMHSNSMSQLYRRL